MNIKKLFFAGIGLNEEKKELSYADLLGLSRDFKFALTKSKVADQADFDSVVVDAEKTLAHDLKRLGQDFEKISPALKNKLMGKIGSMTIIGDDDGKLSVKFHLRAEDGYWDGNTKKHPEKGTTGKYITTIFFPVDDDED